MQSNTIFSIPLDYLSNVSRTPHRSTQIARIASHPHLHSIALWILVDSVSSTIAALCPYVPYHSAKLLPSPIAFHQKYSLLSLDSHLPLQSIPIEYLCRCSVYYFQFALRRIPISAAKMRHSLSSYTTRTAQDHQWMLFQID